MLSRPQLFSPFLTVVVSSMLALSLSAAEEDYVWVEGEDAFSSQVSPHPWYSEQVTKSMLSGGGWISQFTEAGVGTAQYQVELPKDGDWTLWVRANPIQAKLAYRLGSGEWTEVDMDKATDQQNIASDNKPDMRFVAWAKAGAGKLPMKAGKSTIEFKFHSDNNNHGGLDCFLLTTQSFLPNGLRRPGPKKAEAAFDATSFMWVEGEAATESNLQPHSWYSEAVDKGQLSDGGMISTFDGPAEAQASYALTVPKEDEYTLWLRANPIQSKISWKVGSGPWHEVDTSRRVDQTNIANDAKPDLRFLAWINAGKTKLNAGTTTVSLKFDSEANHHGSLDCFVFAAKVFSPNGKVKPGAKLGGAEPGWWAFEPSQDEFTADAQLDLRNLNEKRAGQNGPLTAKGNEVLLADGKAVRFWAVNAGAPDDDGQADYLAARLAKCGVNLTRIHGGVFDRSGNDPFAIDKKHLDRIHYAAKAYAEQGIYVHLSTYFPLWLELKESDGIEGAALGKHPFCLLMFEPKFQAMYRSWLTAILTTKNPYTGKTLAEDPAVGFVEIQNEDGFFFWTFNPENLGSGPWKRLEGLFSTWLIKAYGSTDKAVAAWRGGNVHLTGAWEMTADGFAQAGPVEQRRIRDQIRFLAELQHDFYAKTTEFIKKDLKFTGLVTGSNWFAADNKFLGGIERWTYTATDIVDRHGYFGGKHDGDPAASWSVRPGHTYEDKAAVLDPADTPLGYLQLAGRPHFHSEIAWNKPNRFNADGNLLLASYAGLQGIDGFFLFATATGNWANDGGGKWPMMMPGVLGQFPGAALQFRRGDVTAAPVVIRQVTSVEDQFALRSAGIVEGQNADFRAVEAPKAIDAGLTSAFDPLSYFVGRVERVIAGVPGAPTNAKPVAQDLTVHINRTKKTVTSITGQLSWNWGAGVVTVNSPKSQAVTGYLAKAGVVKLQDVTITAHNEYGTVQVISLDGLPLATSKKMLIQAFSEEKMAGFKATNGVIEDIGHAPITVRNLAASISFANATGLKANALDEHGYTRAAIPVNDGVCELPTTGMYVIVTR